MSKTIGIFGVLSDQKQAAETQTTMTAPASEVPAPEPDHQGHSPFAIPSEENTAGDPRGGRIPQVFKPDDSYVVSEPLGFGYAAPPSPTQSGAPQPSRSASSFEENSNAIKQLELRAVFGMDREMDHHEIIQRASVLPGIRHVATVSSNDVAAVEAVRNVISNLGFESGALKLCSGSGAIEFIREGNIVLAVQTDGSFAPGVRETLILVARELGH